MALVVPIDGELFIAELLRRGLPLAPIAGLFVNDIHPSQTTTFADLAEAGFAGYTRQTMPPWAPATTTPDQAALLVSGPVFFNGTGGNPVQVILGYFLVQLDWTMTMRLISMERVGTGIRFGGGPHSLRLTVPLSFGSFF